MSTNTSNNQLLTFALVLLGILVLIPLLFMGLGMVGYGMMGSWGGPMMGGGTGMTGWAFLLAVVLRVALLAALVGGGYLLYRSLTGESEDGAIEELRSAYARGDLSDEEFERRKERLERDE